MQSAVINSREPRPLAIALALIVAAAAVAVYSGALDNGFVTWDDDSYILDNPAIRSFDGRFLRFALLEFHLANWHPLTWLSHAADYALWGTDPTGHHLTSVALHAIASALAYALAFLLLDSYAAAHPGAQPRSAWGKRIGALVAALLFAVHPTHVESVAWVSERKDVLCAVFFLASLIAYLQYATGPLSRRRGAYGWSIAFLALALLSKPMAVSLPIVLLLIDFALWPLRRPRVVMRGLLLEKLPFLALASMSAAVTIVAQKTGGAVVPLVAFSLGDRLLNALRSLVGYLVLLAWPEDLTPYRPFETDQSATDGRVLLACATLVGISLLAALRLRSGRPGSLALWSYYLVTLVPVIGIVQVGQQAMADRYLYLPSLAPFLALGAGAGALWDASGGRRLRPALLALLASIVGALGIATVAQVEIWESGISLWQHALRHQPDAAVPYQQLGNALLQKGLVDEAMAAYEAGLRHAPGDPDLLNNLAIALMTAARDAEAEEVARRALMLTTGNRHARGNVLNTLGELRFRARAYREAAGYFEGALRLDAGNLARRYNLALAYQEAGEIDDACREWKDYLARAPRSERAEIIGRLQTLRCPEARG